MKVEMREIREDGGEREKVRRKCRSGRKGKARGGTERKGINAKKVRIDKKRDGKKRCEGGDEVGKGRPAEERKGK